MVAWKQTVDGLGQNARPLLHAESPSPIAGACRLRGPAVGRCDARSLQHHFVALAVEIRRRVPSVAQTRPVAGTFIPVQPPRLERDRERDAEMNGSQAGSEDGAGAR